MNPPIPLVITDQVMVEGRGLILCVSRKQNPSVDVLGLRGQQVLANDQAYEVRKIECFLNGFDEVTDRVGLVVRKV